VPDSTTILPISDLEERIDRTADRQLIAAEPVAIPIEPEHEPVAAVSGAGGVAGSVPVMAPRSIAQLAEPESAAVAPASSGAGIRLGTTSPQEVADRIATRVRRAYGLRDTIAAPLVADGAVIGAIVLSRRVADPWPATARRLLDGAAREASMALSRAYSHRAAEVHASVDALTGLPNRRYFDEFCGLLARRRRADDAVGVLMIDIDRFKDLNDRHGHAIGDQVLRAVGGAIMAAVRDDDVPARYGGEEFVVLLRNPSREVAVDVGERVRGAVGALDLDEYGVAGVSVSVGVAVASVPDQPIESLVAEADRALYRAKRAGRDRVVAA
jgi:diguanylate cyclase (GGDEF)-like protein